MIGPIAAIEAFFFRAFNITGRASRAEFWWVALLMGFAFIAAVVWDVMTLATMDRPPLNPLAYMTPILGVLTFIPQMTLSFRRLHDTGRSSLWYLVNFVPFIGPLIMLAMLSFPGDPSDNNWGPPRGGSRSWDDDPQPANGTSAQSAIVGGMVNGDAVNATPEKARKGKHDPMQGYAALLHEDRPPSPQEAAARRAEIHEYYRTKVLKQRPVEI